MIILDDIAEDLTVWAIEKGMVLEMDAQANEVIAKVQTLVKVKFNGDYLAAFSHYDLDHNGKLGHKDVGALLADAGVGNWLTRGTWASGIISELDLDHDGAISPSELAFAMAKSIITQAATPPAAPSK